MIYSKRNSSLLSVKMVSVLLATFLVAALFIMTGCFDSGTTTEENDTYYRDTDGDGFGDPADSLTDQSGQPEGYVANDDDCDDTDASVNPDAVEVCDSIDNDCDNQTDEGCSTYYRDADADGYGDDDETIENTSQPGGYVTDNTDCDDNDVSIHPGAAETCGDGIDQDCTDADLDCPPAGTYFRDSDGDGFGNANDSITDTSQPAGYVTDNTDCDDTNASIHPGAAETCGDGIDQDCSGADITCPPSITHYRDADSDGYGDPDNTTETTETTPPSGYVTDNTDCDDTDASIHPGAVETAGDGIDQDCSGEDLIITFEKTYGGGNDGAFSLDTTSDGGYVLLGVTSAFGSYLESMFLIKTDANGNEEWSSTYGLDAWGTSVRQTSDGGYILLGNTYVAAYDSSDVYLIKTDAYGSEVWSSTFDYSGWDEGISVRQTSDGGYIITGGAEAPDTYESVMFLIKVNADGDQEWRSTYGLYTWGNSVRQTSDGGYIILGDIEFTGTNVLNENIYLVKTDSNGTEEWSKTIGTDDAWGISVEQTIDGGYILLGGINSTTTGDDMYLVKTDSSGNMEWSSTYDSASAEEGHSVQQTADGGYILLGVKGTVSEVDCQLDSSDMYLVKTDSSGNEEWSKTIGGAGEEWDDDGFNTVMQTADGGYILGGYTSSFGANSWDAYLVKLDAAGNGAKNYYNDLDGDGFGDPADSLTGLSQPAGYVRNNNDCNDTDAGINPDADEISADGIDQDCDSSDYINFDKDSCLDGDVWAEMVQQTSDGGYALFGFTDFFSAGNSDMYLIKTDAYGVEEWSETYGGPADEEGGYAGAVQQTADGGYIMIGTTSSYGAGGYDMFLVKTDAAGVEQWNQTFGSAEADWGNYVQQTADGGYILIGGSFASDTVAGDMYVVKTDAAGIEVWSKTYDGGTGDWGNAIQQTADGGFILLGGIDSSGAGSWDFYLVKTDATGNVVWSQTYGGLSDDWGEEVLQTPDGGYVLIGDTSSFGAQGVDGYLVKTDSVGNMEWSRIFGGGGFQFGESVALTSDGGYVTLGAGVGFFAKIDSTGNEVWNKQLAGQSVIQASDGGFVMLPENFTFAKTDPDGDIFD